MDKQSKIAQQPNAFEKVVEFVDERVGLKTIQAKMLNEPVPGGSRWAYAFGSCSSVSFLSCKSSPGILVDVLLCAQVPTMPMPARNTSFMKWITDGSC